MVGCLSRYALPGVRVVRRVMTSARAPTRYPLLQQSAFLLFYLVDLRHHTVTRIAVIRIGDNMKQIDDCSVWRSQLIHLTAITREGPYNT